MGYILATSSVWPSSQSISEISEWETGTHGSLSHKAVINMKERGHFFPGGFARTVPITFDIYIEEVWEEQKVGGGIKWQTLSHNGPIFAPAYERVPNHVKFYYSEYRNLDIGCPFIIWSKNGADYGSS
ncbi:hypothetical protein CEXT_461511 [Caerostris extrusa]|uniref:DNA topoisomerase I DNA binding eukaryotic-type domain-containing protein n=1 Tax=Caerostris extrusa TaxID=172846 RepID=A0AAV4N0C5_CAEEX|nr:hypothetical protein CEXT_461511 [Caerostris extrusa]